MNDETRQDELVQTEDPAAEGAAPAQAEPREAELPEAELAEAGQSETEQSEAGSPEFGQAEESVPAGSETEQEATQLDDDQLGDEIDEADDDDDEPIAVAPQGPIEEIADEDEEIKLDWYILKVQSNRERTSAAALKRKVAIEGIDHLFGEIMVPTEKVTEFKNGKKKVVERKIWPGYIAVQMHVSDDTWFALRETSGIGDFAGASGKPTPMEPHEIAMILHEDEEEGTEETPKLNIKFAEGEKVKVKDGNFENFEGEVHAIDQHSGKVTIMISIFGRSTPVELEYWQVEAV